MKKISNNFRNSIQVAGAIFGGLLIGLPVIFQAANAQQQPTTQPNTRVNPCPSIFYEEPHNSRVMVPQGCRPNAYTMRTQGMNSSNIMGTSSEESGNQSAMTQTSSNSQSSINSQSNTSNSSVNQGTPNSQIDPETGIRTTSGGQSSTNSQSNTSNSSVNQGTPNSQIDPETGIRTTVPISGMPSGGQSSTSGTNTTSSNRYQNAIARVSPTNGQVSVRLVNKTNAAIIYQVIGDTQLRTLAGRSEVMLQGLRTPANVAFYRQDRGLLMVTPQTSAKNDMLDVTLQQTTDFAMDRTSMRIESNGAVYLN